LLAISQIGGPLLILIWGGAAWWLFAQDQQVWGIFMIVWGLLVGMIDNFIKPWLIGFGIEMPMSLTILGVFGGFIAFGFLGLFIGPTLIAILFTLLQGVAQCRCVSSRRRSYEASGIGGIPIVGLTCHTTQSSASSNRSHRWSLSVRNNASIRAQRAALTISSGWSSLCLQKEPRSGDRSLHGAPPSAAARSRNQAQAALRCDRERSRRSLRPDAEGSNCEAQDPTRLGPR
jgi:hypothetical protein